MAQSYTDLWYHIVWSTKHRQPFLQKAWRKDLYRRIKVYCQSKKYHLDCINGVEDHIHLLISFKPTVAISDAVRNIKTDSYYWIINHIAEQEGFGWQDGYGVFSVSSKDIQRVRSYIYRQEEKHRQQSFVDEYSMMKKQSLR